MYYLKTDQGLINGRYIVQVDDFEQGKVQVAFLYGEKIRHAIASVEDFRTFLSTGR